MTFAAPIGEPPSVSWEPCEALMVDHFYQRMIEGAASQRLIQHIAENWDWRLCAPLTVSNRCDLSENDDPGYYVIDGQHRLRAAELRGDIAELPCIISKFGSIEAEALCFVSINSARRQVSSLDRFQARIAAKDPLALEVKEVVESAGLTIARIPDHAFWKPLEIAFPDSVASALRMKKANAAFFALYVLAQAYPTKKLRQGRELFEGLSTLHSRSSKHDVAAVAAVIGEKRQLDWVIARDKHRTMAEIPSSSDAMADVIEAMMPEAPAPALATTAPPERFASAGRDLTPPTPPAPPGSATSVWCDQCDKMVKGHLAAACASPFCKAKAA